MEEKKDALKAIQQFAEEQPTRTDKLEQAKQLTEELYGEDESARSSHRGGRAAAAAVSGRRNLTVTLALCFAALLLVAVLLFVFLWDGNSDPLRYYDDGMIYNEQITDINEYKSANDLNFFCYEEGFVSAQNEAYRLIDGDELVFILQNALFLNQSSFDSVMLGICFSNDEFQRFADFIGLEESIRVGEIDIAYKIESDNRNNIYSKFSVDDVVYYLSITTSGGAETIARYVEMLVS